MLIYGLLAMASGLTMLLWPHSRAKRVAERLQAGDDQYLEEQRAYRAYPSLREAPRIRLGGAIVTACGALLLILRLFGG